MKYVKAVLLHTITYLSCIVFIPKPKTPTQIIAAIVIYLVGVLIALLIMERT